MTLSSLLSHWKSDPDIATNIVEWRSLAAQPARFVDFPASLSHTLVRALKSLGIQALYTHQAASWEHAQAGYNIVVVTGTASGKTLCYNLPVLDYLLRNPVAHALYLFPTKALAQDQQAAITDILSAISDPHSSERTSRSHPSGSTYPVPLAIYDGDTPQNARTSIRNTARLIISNPDMLHMGILPHHTAWAGFFRSLQFVVIDEIHTYRGVFGSHVANVLRRLKRIAHFYGSNPQFILTSATIGNPAELASKLIEEPVLLVDDDGAARGIKHFLLYNPPVIKPDLGLRRSSLQEAVRLAEDLLEYNVQTIIFGRARRTVELILTYLKTAYNSSHIITPPHQQMADEVIRGYRGGYLPHERRVIERGLRQGSIRMVVATNALELGIDIGGMGATVLTGYPGTIAATWQQAGRSGRTSEASLAVLITSANPLDQFLAHHPEYFFGRSPEQALINPDNLLILLAHLRCSSFELPFQEGEAFGDVDAPHLREFLEFLQEEGILRHTGNRYFWLADQYPAEKVSLRSASPETIVLQVEDNNSSQIIGEVDIPSATWMVHPGAVYLHEARTYLVDDLDLDTHIAHLHPADVDYYTEPRQQSVVQMLEKYDEQDVLGGLKTHGEITITSQVVGFRKIKWFTNETLGLGEVLLPPNTLQTTSYWLTLADKTVEQLEEQGVWSNAHNNYGPNWPTQRDRVRARDGYRCQVCGLPEQGHAHPVHHISPFRSFMMAEQANQLTNLITLCPSCHRRAETAVRIRSGLAGLSFVLGNLAPLFLMCDVRDLGVHSDPQSSLSDGKPVVAIYDQVPAGIGFSERLFEIHDELIAQACDLVSACECTDGCPSCVGPGGEGGSGSKRETLAILKLLVPDKPAE